LWWALVEALATLLHNVRRYALAQEVVVHVERDEVSWELVVRDDGVGFDPAQTSLGYGLRRPWPWSARSAGRSVSAARSALAPRCGCGVRQRELAG